MQSRSKFRTPIFGEAGAQFTGKATPAGRRSRGAFSRNDASPGDSNLWKRRLIVPINCRGLAGTAALPDYVHSCSPILRPVLARAVRDARRSRPEGCSTRDRIGAGCARVGPAAPRAVQRPTILTARRSILASRQNHVRGCMGEQKHAFTTGKRHDGPKEGSGGSLAVWPHRSCLMIWIRNVGHCRVCAILPRSRPGRRENSSLQ
jgi:hypothetical protein